MTFSEIRKHTDAAALAVAVAIYLSLALPLLSLPGLQYDEVLFINAASGRGSGSFVVWAVSIGKLHIPLMLMHYMGALKAWLYAPILAVAGASTFTVRLPMALLGLLTLIFTWFIARRLFGQRAAVVSALLLATDPTFIYCNRLDWGPVTLSLVLKTAGMLLVLRWLEAGGPFLLMGIGFLFGLGLFDKVTFAWFVVAMAVALPVSYWPAVRGRLSRRSLLAGVAGLLLGAAPLLAYNLYFRARTLEGQKTIALPSPTQLSSRKAVLEGTLDGSEPYIFFNSLSRGEFASEETGSLADRFLPRRTLTWYGWLAAIIATVVCLFTRRCSHRQPKILVLALSLLITGMIVVTVRATGPHHALMLYPLPQLLISSVLVDLGDWLSRKIPSVSAIRLTGTVVIVAFLIPQTGMAVRYLRSFQRDGGGGYWSDAIYRLADFALRNPDRQFILMEWGFQNQLQVLGGGRISMRELFPLLKRIPEGQARRAALLSWLLRDGSYYVFHHPRFGQDGSLGLFERVVLDNGLIARVVQTFFQRNGEPIYVVYEVLPTEAEALLRSGRFYQRWEAEGLKRNGGGIERDDGASHGTILGNSWGGSTADSVFFDLDSARALTDAHLRLRFDREANTSIEYQVEIDGRTVATFTLPPTRPLRNYRRNWSYSQVSLGDIPAGHHQVRFHPARDNSPVLIDTITITEGPAPAPSELTNQRIGKGFIESLDVLGFIAAPEVRLEVEPPEIIAGEGYLTLRVRGLKVGMIDVLYELDGQRQPVLYGWPLDEHQTSIVPVAAGTPRGVYRYVAIRDSRARSATAWIQVSAVARVK